LRPPQDDIVLDDEIAMDEHIDLSSAKPQSLLLGRPQKKAAPTWVRPPIKQHPPTMMRRQPISAALIPSPSAVTQNRIAQILPFP